MSGRGHRLGRFGSVAEALTAKRVDVVIDNTSHEVVKAPMPSPHCERVARPRPIREP